jgi:hypothetical protein
MALTLIGCHICDSSSLHDAQRLHEYLQKLLLTPDEFMQLLEDC